MNLKPDMTKQRTLDILFETIQFVRKEFQKQFPSADWKDIDDHLFSEIDITVDECEEIFRNRGELFYTGSCIKTETPVNTNDACQNGFLNHRVNPLTICAYSKSRNDEWYIEGYTRNSDNTVTILHCGSRKQETFPVDDIVLYNNAPDEKPRDFKIDTPIGKLHVYAKHETDTPDDYPGVYVDFIRKDAEPDDDDELLAVVEYDACANDILACLYATPDNMDEPSTVQHFPFLKD